ncbi:hypothetical protein AB9X29_003756 [Vibrio vulnificus]
MTSLFIKADASTKLEALKAVQDLIETGFDCHPKINARIISYEDDTEISSLLYVNSEKGVVEFAQTPKLDGVRFSISQSDIKERLFAVIESILGMNLPKFSHISEMTELTSTCSMKTLKMKLRFSK